MAFIVELDQDDCARIAANDVPNWLREMCEEALVPKKKPDALAIMPCCGRDESQPHTADCEEALRQDAADGDRAARAELVARGEVAG